MFPRRIGLSIFRASKLEGNEVIILLCKYGGKRKQDTQTASSDCSLEYYIYIFSPFVECVSGRHCAVWLFPFCFVEKVVVSLSLSRAALSDSFRVSLVVVARMT